MMIISLIYLKKVDDKLTVGVCKERKRKNCFIVSCRSQIGLPKNMIFFLFFSIIFCFCSYFLEDVIICNNRSSFTRLIV